MDEKIAYVDRFLGFRFEHGFACGFDELGSPEGDLDVWFKNAQVYERVTRIRAPEVHERISLTILIEAIRFEAMFPPALGEQYDFDVSAYEFSEDILTYKADVVEAVLRQEASAPSVLDT